MTFFTRYDADLNKRSLSFPFAGRSFRFAAMLLVPPSSVLESLLVYMFISDAGEIAWCVSV